LQPVILIARRDHHIHRGNSKLARKLRQKIDDP
jgi:hypothetical protein